MPLILLVIFGLFVFPGAAWADWVLVQTQVNSPPTGPDSDGMWESDYRTLQMNHPDIVRARHSWVTVGWHPPQA